MQKAHTEHMCKILCQRISATATPLMSKSFVFSIQLSTPVSCLLLLHRTTYKNVKGWIKMSTFWTGLIPCRLQLWEPVHCHRIKSARAHDCISQTDWPKGYNNNLNLDYLFSLYLNIYLYHGVEKYYSWLPVHTFTSSFCSVGNWGKKLHNILQWVVGNYVGDAVSKNEQQTELTFSRKHFFQIWN